MNSLVGLSSRRPDISISPSGAITISARVVHTLKIQPGDILDFINDNSTVYITIRHRAKDVFGCHHARAMPVNTRTTTGSFRIWSVPTARKLCRMAAHSATAPLRVPAGEPVTLNNQTLIPLILKQHL